MNKVKARSLFCYWSSSELGISELARRSGISVSGVGYCIERGKQIAAESGYWGVPLNYKIVSLTVSFILIDSTTEKHVATLRMFPSFHCSLGQ